MIFADIVRRRAEEGRAYSGILRLLISLSRAWEDIGFFRRWRMRGEDQFFSLVR